MAVVTYDPSKVSVILGTNSIDGFDESQMISLEYNQERWIPKVGARGGTARTRVIDSQARLSIFLLSSSPSNDLLSNLFNADYYGGGSTFPILIRDASGTSQAFATTAYVIKLPTFSREKEIGSNEWGIHIDDLTVFIGGNSLQGT